MATTVGISFGLFDLTAKEDSSFFSENIQPFSNLTMLKSDSSAVLPWASYEEDYFRGDGTFRLVPDDPSDWKYYDFGWWSLSQPEDGGANPVLEINFTESHSSPGLQFRFNPLTDDYPSRMIIRWYGSTGTLITEREFQPDASTWFARQGVADYRRIEIEVLATKKPNRFAKVVQIDHGEEINFARDTLRNVNLHESANALSSEIGINTLSFTLYSKDDDFNIMQPQGIFQLLQQKQQLLVTGRMDDRIIPFGTFYLEEWNAVDERNMTITAVNLIGIMDLTYFAGGLYFDYPVPDIISDIFHSFDPYTQRYELDPYFANMKISGWIRHQSHREALQEVAFACGMIIDASRVNKAVIFPYERLKPTRVVGKGRKFTGSQSVNLRPRVTGVRVIGHSYAEGDTLEDIAKIDVDIGEHLVTFKEPIHDISVTGGQLLWSTVNQARVLVTSPGLLVVRGKKYIDSMSVLHLRDPNYATGEVENDVTVEDATLVGSHNSAEVAVRVFAYYQRRHIVESKIIYGSEETGSGIRLEAFNDLWLVGYLEEVSIDLSGGYITRIKAAGNPEGG